MREILFRGKRVDNEEWVCGSLISVDTCDGSYCCILEQNEGIRYEYPYLDPDLGTIDGQAIPVIPETVGEYTGVKDKNGIKIFEGDVVRYKAAYGSFYCFDEMIDARDIDICVKIVKYENGKFSPLPYCDICDDYWYSEGAFDFEVVDNIHDLDERTEVKNV